ncbi:MAG: class I SAM-dependent methyltransferase [Thermoanaerobaculales bacterium]|nr:class I SAM-dependent methyltransferase [Thermoanaerobaculales bacterium]
MPPSPRSPFRWVCPECLGPLEARPPGTLRCPADGLEFGSRGGVLGLIAEDRLAGYREFLGDYERVRRGEARGVPDAETYRALPFADRTGRHPTEWRIRARSYRSLLARVVEPLAAERGPLKVADLGAGTTWMSRRLALAGHSVAALDILTGETDGLGAARFSEVAFETVQAEFDRLPLAGDSLDLAVFNGALHYSTDYARTLGEALRVVSPGGVVAVIDSPLYRSDPAGRQMVEERRSAFLRDHGLASDSIPCRGYLTFAELAGLARSLGLEWRMHRPFYGLRWSLRPLLARVRGRREPVTFLVLWAVKRPGGAAGRGRGSGPQSD